MHNADLGAKHIYPNLYRSDILAFKIMRIKLSLYYTNTRQLDIAFTYRVGSAMYQVSVTSMLA